MNEIILLTIACQLNLTVSIISATGHRCDTYLFHLLMFLSDGYGLCPPPGTLSDMHVRAFMFFHGPCSRHTISMDVSSTAQGNRRLCISSLSVSNMSYLLTPHLFAGYYSSLLRLDYERFCHGQEDDR